MLEKEIIDFKHSQNRGFVTGILSSSRWNIYDGFWRTQRWILADSSKESGRLYRILAPIPPDKTNSKEYHEINVHHS